jgi:hypothetical protein
MTTSSMTSLSTLTLGRSPTMTRLQRSAALLNAFFCFGVRPPRNRTSIVKGETAAVAGASSAAIDAFDWAM